MQQRCIAAPFRGNASGVQQRRRLPGSKLHSLALPGTHRTHNLASSKPARVNLARAEPPGSGSFQEFEGPVLALLQALDSKVEAARVALDKARDAYLADPDNQRLWEMYKDAKEMYQDANHGLQKLMDTYKDLQAKLPGPRQEPVAAVSTGAGAAAGTATSAGLLVLGSAPCGPPSYNLATEAAQLVDEVPPPGCPPCFARVVWDDGVQDFVIDVNHHLRQAMQDWLDQSFPLMSRSKHKTEAKHKPLFLNGLTKTGKSYALNVILPAVLRDHPQFGLHGPHQTLVFRLSMNKLPTALGFHAQLHNLLLKLLRWLQQHNVPVRKEAWDQAVGAAASQDVRLLEDALMALLHGIQAPVVMLLDEIQAWFLPRGAGGVVDPNEAEEARRVFKDLVTDGPDWMLWAVTGSSMATFWVNIAMTHKGGVALLRHHRMVNVPSSVDEAAMQRCWQGLVERHAPKLQDAELLYKLAGTTPALLTYVVTNWLADGSPPNMYDYVMRHNYDKLLSEALDDWSLAIQFLSLEDRVALYELSSVEVGINLEEQLEPGVAHMLRPFTQPVRPGSSRVCLRSVIHRELIQNLVTPDGQVQRAWRGKAQAGSLQHLEAQKLLLKLGNAVVAADVADWDNDADKQLKQDLQEMACSLEQTHGPMATWCSAPWFQRVLHSKYNQRGAAPYFRKIWKLHEQQQQLLEPWQFVAQYSRMLRNCLGHEEFEDEQLLPGDDGLPMAFTAEDVDLIESWPFAKTARIAAIVGPIRSRWLDTQRSTGADSTKGTGSAGVSTAAAKSGHRGSRSSDALFAAVASHLLPTPEPPSSRAPWPKIYLNKQWQRNSRGASE